MKKASLLALTPKNFSGKEADAVGLISMAVPAAELEATTNRIAREIASRDTMLGEQSDEILKSVGYPSDEIAALRNDGAPGR